MKLRTQFVLWTSLAVVLILLVGEILRQVNESHQLRKLSESTAMQIESSAFQNLNNLQFSLHSGLIDAMDEGDMDRLERLLEGLKSMEGLMESSVFGSDATIHYSTDEKRIGSSIGSDLQRSTFKEEKRITRQVSGAFEVYQPIIAQDSCMICHGEWDLGQVCGVEYVKLSDRQFQEARNEWKTSSANLRRSSLISGVSVSFGLLAMLVLILSFLVKWLLVKPLHKLTLAMEHGDLSTRLDESRKDEIGSLARCFNSFVSNLHKTIRQVSSNSITLAGSSQQLIGISENMRHHSNETSSGSSRVAEHAKKLSVEINAASTEVKQATDRLQSTADSTQKLTNAIGNIASTSENARSITQTASEQAKTVAELVQKLNIAANEIGKVTETISMISDQTKLLALNAKIEAARAGESGKGFAVVAEEITELARQTTKATVDIHEKVEAIQNSTHATLSDMEIISEIIGDVNETVSSIALAVEEQSESTQEISFSVQDAVSDINHANRRMTEITDVTNSVSSEIDHVDETALKLDEISKEIHQSAGDFSEMAKQLKELVDQFQL